MALLTLLGMSCSSAADREKWGAGSGPGLCFAMREGRDEALTLNLSDPGSTGIAIGARPFDDAVPEVAQERISLLINGSPVHSHAVGVRFGGSPGRSGIGIIFNLRQTLGRHRNGFALTVLRDGSEIYHDEVGEAARQAIQETTACDRARRFGQMAR
jgi:hypothetical protein